MGDVVDPVKIFLTSRLITMQNLVAVSHVVVTHVEGPNNFGDPGAPPLDGAWLTMPHPLDGAWLTPRNMLLPYMFPHQI